MNKLLSAVAVAGAVTAATLAATTTATAAPSPDDAVAICGGGYVEEEAALAYGTVYLVYDDASATHCVTTINETDFGYTPWVCAWIDDGVNYVEDCGYYDYYAGPVYTTSYPFQWGGSIEDSYVVVEH